MRIRDSTLTLPLLRNQYSNSTQVRRTIEVPMVSLRKTPQKRLFCVRVVTPYTPKIERTSIPSLINCTVLEKVETSRPWEGSWTSIKLETLSLVRYGRGGASPVIYLYHRCNSRKDFPSTLLVVKPFERTKNKRTNKTKKSFQDSWMRLTLTRSWLVMSPRSVYRY